jgi:amino acid transporter
MRYLSQVQRTLMYNPHQIAGVIGTGLFLGLGQLLAITGPLGVLLVFLLVGSVAFASVLSSVPNSRSDLEVTYLIAP